VSTAAERMQLLQRQLAEIRQNYNKQRDHDFRLLWILALSMIVGLTLGCIVGSMLGAYVAWTVAAISGVIGLSGENHILRMDRACDIQTRLNELQKLEHLE